MKKPNKNKENNKEKYKHNEIRGLVLNALGLSILIGGTIVFSPNFPIIYGAILKLIEEIKGERVPEKKIKRVLENLEEREIINLTEKGDKVIIEIKDCFNKSILTYSLKSIFDFKKRTKKWNGKWYLVFFDVPEVQKNKREYLRNYLKKLGFYLYQKSVYIFPYECEGEVKLIKKIVEGAKYMKYIIADKIEDEENVKKYFKLG